MRSSMSIQLCSSIPFLTFKETSGPSAGAHDQLIGHFNALVSWCTRSAHTFRLA